MLSRTSAGVWSTGCHAAMPTTSTTASTPPSDSAALSARATTAGRSDAGASSALAVLLQLAGAPRPPAADSLVRATAPQADLMGASRDEDPLDPRPRGQELAAIRGTGGVWARLGPPRPRRAARFVP